MSEYAVSMDVNFLADDLESARREARRLSEAVFEQENVVQVSTEEPELYG